MISLQNSIKKVLLGEVTTNKKTQVPWEINGWLETNQKTKGAKINIAKRRSIADVVKSLDYCSKVDEKVVSQLKLKSQKQSRTTRASTCYRTRLRYKKEDKIQSEKVQYPSQTVEIAKVDMSAIRANEAKLKPKHSCKGYILHEMRRRKKQQSHIRHYSSISIHIPEKENICTMNTNQSINYLQRKFRVVSTTNRNHGQKYLLRR